MKKNKFKNIISSPSPAASELTENVYF